MLLNDFFHIHDIQTTDKYTVAIVLNAKHTIYDGHFPNNPITPGVCMTQMLKESVEQITQKKLQLVNASNLKFMAVLNPEVHPKAVITITLKDKGDERIHAEGNIAAGEVVFFSFKGSFKEQ
ncbi:MAG TPA: 3-hydroxyacyl-ACP dehydratase [Bacteroidia bacterium]|jgi:3-hydroxyacyl-[acyl-carrier-protein] dehydratase|nr:3-hydroxyacyl-ACP dehydratase [Bacteroidia bacterium]